MKIKEKTLKRILSQRTKTEDILIELSKENIVMSGRQWRKFVRDYNDDYSKRDRYIASNNKGYILTTKKKEINKTISNKFKNGLSMIKNAQKDFKNLSQKNQISFIKDEPELYDLILKLEQK